MGKPREAVRGKEIQNKSIFRSSLAFLGSASYSSYNFFPQRREALLLSAPVETQVQCKADIIIIIGSWHAPPKFPHAQERTVLKQNYGRQHDVYLARGGTANLREWRVRPNIYIFYETMAA